MEKKRNLREWEKNGGFGKWELLTRIPKKDLFFGQEKDVCRRSE